MELVNRFIECHGIDKVLHFLVASNIISFGSLFGLYGIIGAWAILIPLMFLKEFLDDPYDWYDILWGAYGGAFASFIYLISIFYV